MPVELATSPLEVVINDVNDDAMGDDTAAAQWGKKEAAAAEKSDGKSDAKDWKDKPVSSGKESAAGAKAGSEKKKSGGRVDLTPLPEGTEGAEIVKAENAWARGATDDAKTKTTRAIKGILNKITPEKFDRLMEQLLECGIDDAATLSETISIVFDKAIWEPGFCGMYADVCLRLSKELPEFPSGVEGGKPVTFRRILLNTCQEEFEGAGKARDELESIADPAERAAAAKRVKVRTMGNIKLIGELYKKRMIAEKILHACVTDLLGSPSVEPPEENVEALCNLLVTVGKELDASPKLPKQMMEMYFARLAALADESSKLDSRVRFLCRDVIELRKADWVPRVKKLEAMTLSEIHAEAAAALGISPAHTEEILFPEADGWEIVGKNGKAGSSNNLAAMGGGKQSSLSGPYVAASHKAAMPTEKEKLKRDAQLREAARERAQAALVGPATPSISSDAGPVAVAGAMDAEKVEEKTKSLVNEYMQVADLNEAVLCVKEIVAGAKDANALGAMTKRMVAHVVDVSTEKARDLIAKLLAACVKRCGVSAEAVFADLLEQIEALEDIAIDVPMAPKLLGVMLAQLIIEGALEAATLNAATLKIDEGAVPTRRDFAAAALRELKNNGKGGLAEYVTKSGLDVAAALTGDEKFDGPLAAFLEKNGLKELC